MRTKNLGPCTFDGCVHDAWAKELCLGHYQQQRRGKELTPLKVYKKYAAPAPGKKICTSCERILDREKDFYKVGKYVQSNCKKCKIEDGERRRKEAAS